jgi:hypothetical protein
MRICWLSRTGAVATLVLSGALMPVAASAADAFTAGRNSSGSITIDHLQFTLVRNIATLASDIAANPAGNFALADDYDASQDGTYASSPVTTIFTGIFDGRGHTISNLAINDPTVNAQVALFAEIGSGAKLRNINLTNENIVGGPGSSYGGSTEEVGGLVGFNSGGSIARASVTGSLAGGEYAAVGGLVGVSYGEVRDSSASVTETIGNEGGAGGLVGFALTGGNIIGSHATVEITGSSSVDGGIAGYTNAIIDQSYANDAIADTSSDGYVGGIVGINEGGALRKSFATGSVQCSSTCGGLAGINSPLPSGIGAITQSYSTASVEGESAGGLVGYNQEGTISNSYATGAVSGNTAGGLVGYNAGNVIAISKSYSTGLVTGAAGSAGGLVGSDQFSGTIENSYWDTTTSGITDLSQGAGNISNDPGITGLSTTQLQFGLPSGFRKKIWGENSNINNGLPYLLALPPS